MLNMNAEETTHKAAIGSTALRKLTLIQGVGRFRKMAASGDVEFRKLNLIYGDNGRGKTTLCAIFRSLQTGDVGLIHGRRTLGHSLDPHIQILTAGEPPIVTFHGTGWSRLLPDLAIYDQTFVSQNVYAGEAVGTDQKRNLFKVIVGQEAVRAASRLEAVIREVRQLQAEIREAQAAVKSHCPPDLKLEDFLRAEPDPGIDAKIAAAAIEIRAAQEADRLRTQPGLRLLQAPPLADDVPTLLGESLESISTGAEQLVRDHIDRHGMRGGAAGQAWLAQGLDFRPEEGCPFCGQSVDGLDLLGAYRTLFSRSYRELKERVTQRGVQLAEAFGDAARMALAETLRSNAAAHSFWGGYVDLPPVGHEDVSNAADIAHRYGESLLRALRRKVAAPLEPIILDAEAIAAMEAYRDLLERTAAYKEACAAANRVIETRRATADGGALPQLILRHSSLEMLKRRHSQSVAPLCDRLVGLLTRRKALEGEREQLKEQLDTQVSSVESYQEAINRYLELFNAEFQIAKVEHNYVGGVNASFQLSINKVAVPLGDEKTPIDRPSFRNTLSAGDRSTLALAFFLAQLDRDPGTANRVVVFDDPFTSQDSFRRNQSAIEIARIAARCAQVIVLSHDANFLKRVEEKAHGQPVKALKLQPVGDDTHITDLDLTAMLRSELRAHVDALQTYYRSGEGRPDNIVCKIRPLLEGYCRSICLTQFEAMENLGSILSTIRMTGDDHPLISLYPEISDINDYTRRYHHADGEVLTELIDEAELRGIVRRCLKIVKAYG